MKKLRCPDDFNSQETPVCVEVEHHVPSTRSVHDDLLDGNTGRLMVGKVEVSGVCFDIQFDAHNAFHHIGTLCCRRYSPTFLTP